MSNEQHHTPEPWPNPDTGAFAFMEDGTGSQLNGGVLSLTDYLRAIACVNACAGMDDPAAEIARLREAESTAVRESVRACLEIARQRDELLAALKECVSELEAYEAPKSPLDSHNVRLAQARAVIDKVEGS